ncbi:MAG: oligosaccharide flippase family protein [Candidatus Altimarinota bacterium]
MSFRPEWRVSGVGRSGEIWSLYSREISPLRLSTGFGRNDKENMIPNPTLSVLNRKIAFSTIVQYVGKIVQMGLAMVTIKLISNFLSEEGYGTYAAITEYALFFSVAANLGIFANVVRKMADAPKDGKVFLNALVLRLVTAGLFFLSGVLFLLFQGSDSVFVFGSVLFFGTLFFDYITSVCDGALQANYRMGRATLALVLGKMVSTGMIYFLITQYSATDIPFLLAASVSGSIFTAFLSVFFVVRTIDWQWSIDRTFMWEILKVSIPFGIINILNNLYFRFLPDYFAHRILSGAQFATFNISFRIAQVFSLFSTFLMFSVLPGLREYIDGQHWGKVKVLYQRVGWLLLVTGVLLVAIGSWFGPFMIELLTHKKYFLPEFWFVLPMMLLLAAISYGYDFILITLFALDKDLWILKRECLALSMALLVFLSSLLVDGVQLKLLLILLGAIVGEGVMVWWGVRKVRRILKGGLLCVSLACDLISFGSMLDNADDHFFLIEDFKGYFHACLWVRCFFLLLRVG